MPYRNVKVQKRALSTTIERAGNGYMVRPEYASVGYDERAEHNEVYTSLASAMQAAKRMLEKGLETEKEEWCEDAEDGYPTRRRKGY